MDSHGGYTIDRGETTLCAVRRYEVYPLHNIILGEDEDDFVILG